MINWRNPSIQRFGEKFILMSWQEEIKEELLYFILSVKEEINKDKTDLMVEVINTYHTLLIEYVQPITAFDKEKLYLEEILKRDFQESKSASCVYTIPVCYEEEFGIDLKTVAQDKDLSIKEVIRYHTQPIYTIFFIGFLPGFLYLGGLDARLKVSRKRNPRLKVDQGAVGLAEDQTGIYPQQSAGGWQIIGNSPLSFFSSHKEPPTIFSPGDKIQFQSIAKKEYLSIANEVKKGKYTLDYKSCPL